MTASLSLSEEPAPSSIQTPLDTVPNKQGQTILPRANTGQVFNTRRDAVIAYYNAFLKTFSAVLPQSEYKITFQNSQSPLTRTIYGSTEAETVDLLQDRIIHGVRHTLHQVVIRHMEVTFPLPGRHKGVETLYLPQISQVVSQEEWNREETLKATVRLPGKWACACTEEKVMAGDCHCYPLREDTFPVQFTHKYLTLTLKDAMRNSRKEAEEDAATQKHFGLIYPTRS